MGEKNVTVMILKADLQCECCYKRVRKALCRIPEIRDWIFDEKANTVTIKAVCCDPDRLRNKLCHKGRGSIKSIEIKEPLEPKPVADPPADPPNAKDEKPTPSQAPEPIQKPPEPAPKPPEPVPKPVEPEPKPVESLPLFGSEPMPICCKQFYGSLSAGPCSYGYGAPSVYCEGYYYGRIQFGPNGPNLCHHPHPVGCSVM